VGERPLEFRFHGIFAEAISMRVILLACIMMLFGTGTVVARPAIAFDRGRAPGRMPELYDRVVQTCLAPGRKFVPVFLQLDEMNFESELITAYMHSTGIQEHLTDRGGSPKTAGDSAREVMDQLAAEVVAYADRSQLDAFQRACLAQCVGYQWYKDTPENAPSTGDITTGAGNCRHSTYLASFLHERLGTPDRMVNNGVSEMWRGIGHTFSEVNVGGLPFVMNNNLSSDALGNLCVFRFTRIWDGHNACQLFSDPILNSRYFKAYGKAWNRESDPSTGRPATFSGAARSCNSHEVTVSGPRVCTLLVRDPNGPSPARARASPEPPGVNAGSGD